MTSETNTLGNSKVYKKSNQMFLVAPGLSQAHSSFLHFKQLSLLISIRFITSQKQRGKNTH